MNANDSVVRLEIPSSFDMLDFVQLVCDSMGQLAGIDEDSLHWIGVAVREAVINAIKHGNREDLAKLVTVEFVLAPPIAHAELVIRIRDEGEGFEPGEVGNPLSPENLMKSSGRGIFFMRSFIGRRPAGQAARGRHGSAHGEAPGRRRLTARLASCVTTRVSSPPPSTSSCAPARSSWRTCQP